jgi:hypothetical protein
VGAPGATQTPEPGVQVAFGSEINAQVQQVHGSIERVDRAVSEVHGLLCLQHDFSAPADACAECHTPEGCAVSSCHSGTAYDQLGEAIR